MKINKTGGGKFLLIISCILNIYFVSNTIKKRIEFKYHLEHPTPSQAIVGWTNTLTKLDLKVDIAFFGNSITRNSSFHEIFPDKKIINLGCGGDRIEDMLIRMKMLKAVHADKIFIMAGINGSKDINLKDFLNKYNVLIDSIQINNPKSQLYIQSILPISKEKENTEHYTDNITIQKMNVAIKSICKARNIPFIDLYSLYSVDGYLPFEYTRNDGIHIKDKYYSIWSDRIRQYIYE